MQNDTKSKAVNTLKEKGKKVKMKKCRAQGRRQGRIKRKVLSKIT